MIVQMLIHHEKWFYLHQGILLLIKKLILFVIQLKLF